MAWLHSEKIKLDEDKLTFAEKRVLEVIREHGPIGVNEIARIGFPGVRERPKSEKNTHHPAYRRVLNALRRVVASRRAKKIKRGTYAAI